MVDNSALITVGESEQSLARSAQGLAPCGEYSVLRRHFGRVLAMADHGLNPGSLLAHVRFAARAYAESWDDQNILLGEEFPGIPYVGVHAAVRSRKRIAMLIHNATSLNRRIPLSTLRLARRADHLFCLSEHSRREIEGRYGVRRRRITVLGSRVDSSFFRPQPQTKVLCQVCSAGAVNRDYHCLIEAVRPLDVPTKIAVDSPWSRAEGLNGERHVPGCVEMRSWGGYRELRDLYAESAVIVVPLARQRMSGVTVVLEAMAMGKPVIVTRTPYLEDFVQHGENGFFVPSHDTEALRHRIRYVLDRPDEAERVGQRAREWVAERFTVDQYVQRMLDIW